jgi:hypothetical protein
MDPIAHLWNEFAASFLLLHEGHDVSLGGQIILPSRTTLRFTGDWVYSSSATKSLRLICDVVLLLNRNSPDLIFVFSIGDVGLDLRLTFFGGLGPSGDNGE